METDFRYQLDKSSKKYICPGCGKKTLVRYIDAHTGQLLPEHYGRCDREANCAYHLNPYKEGYGKEEEAYHYQSWRHASTIVAAAPSTFIPVDVLKSTLKGYSNNCFINNLRYNIPYPFAAGDLETVIAQYYLGTVQDGERMGAVTFPFINTQGRVCAIQVKEFDLLNHTTDTEFIHSVIERSRRANNEPLPEWLVSYRNNEKKITCLFGDHMLKEYRHNPIALVEAPKTAIIGTLYFGFPDDPQNLLWLAVYNLSSLTLEKVHSLKGRYVYLFPDLSKQGHAFNLWTQKAQEFLEKMPGTFFKVSDLLEKEADPQERIKGCDIADYLIKQDWRKFRNQGKGEKGEKSEDENKPFFLSNNEHTPFSEKNISEKRTWDKEIAEQEQFFSMRDLPKDPIKLSAAETIINASLFVNTHLSIIRAQNGNNRYLPYLERLQELMKILKN